MGTDRSRGCAVIDGAVPEGGEGGGVGGGVGPDAAATVTTTVRELAAPAEFDAFTQKLDVPLRAAVVKVSEVAPLMGESTVPLGPMYH